jgi:simple sugar transport system substrate-binding protein
MALMAGVATGKEMRFGPAGGATGRTYFSVTHDIFGDPFWTVYRNGLRDAAERFECAVLHLAPRQYSPHEMVTCIDRARQARPDGVIATVPEPEVVDAPLRRIVEAGIPLIVVNMPDPRPGDARIPYLTYVGPSDELGGRVAAERLLRERIEPRRLLCVDHYRIENASHRARREGLIPRLEQDDVEVEVVRVDGHALDEAAKDLARWLGEHEVGAVCTLGPPGAAAVLKALDGQGLSGRVPHGSFDLSDGQLAALESGQLLFTIDSQQYLQGYLGVELLHLYVANGFSLAGDVRTGPRLLEREAAATVRAGVDAGLR